MAGAGHTVYWQCMVCIAVASGVDTTVQRVVGDGPIKTLLRYVQQCVLTPGGLCPKGAGESEHEMKTRTSPHPR